MAGFKNTDITSLYARKKVTKKVEIHKNKHFTVNTLFRVPAQMSELLRKRRNSVCLSVCLSLPATAVCRQRIAFGGSS
jgi:hypothetical protein